MAEHGTDRNGLEGGPGRAAKAIRVLYLLGGVLIIAALAMIAFSPSAAMVCGGLGSGLVVAMWMVTRPDASAS